MTRKRIMYVGWVGCDNVGDEALCRVSRKVFNPYHLSVCNFTLFKPNRFLIGNFMQQSGITLFGGGTVLPAWTAFILPNTYNYAFGVAVTDPSFCGRFSPFLINRMKGFAFRFLGVRGYSSQRTLSEIGIESEVIGDPALLLSAKSPRRRDETRVGINVGITGNHLWGGDDQIVLSEIANICDALLRNSYRPVLIPFYGPDYPFIAKISKDTKAEIFEEWRDVDRLLDFLSSCQIVIGEKLHSLILSAAVGTPFISLEYRPKCFEFSDMMGFREYNIRTDQLTSREVMKKFATLEKRWDDKQKLLLERVTDYRERLRGFGQSILRDIRTLPDDSWSARPTSLPKALTYYLSGRMRMSENGEGQKALSAS